MTTIEGIIEGYRGTKYNRRITFACPLRAVQQHRPRASPAAGTYIGTQTVELSTTTLPEFSKIYYTLDGSQPFEKNKEVSESAKKYEGPITVEKNTILRAAARKDGVEYGTGSWYYLIGAQSQDNWETPKAPSDVRIDSKSSSSANISWLRKNRDVHTVCMQMVRWYGKEKK